MHNKTWRFTMLLRMMKSFQTGSTTTYVYNGPSCRYSGRILSGGNTTTIIFWVDFMVLEVDDMVVVTPVKSALSPIELCWWVTLQQQYTSIHLGKYWCITYAMIELYSQFGFWWRAMIIIIIFTSVSSFELFFTAILLNREYRGHPC
jgi:hypothetical protein